MKITEGEYTNLKITTPEDLVVASQVLEARRISDLESGPADTDQDEEEEYLSVTRANEVWTDTPHAVGGAEEEEDDIESISALRANEKWVDSPVGNAPQPEGEVDILLDLSKMRADE